MTPRATLLVVDDQPDLLANLASVLETVGYTVLTAGDGALALSILDSEPVDLILADIAMPVINGYQLLEAVRARPQLAAVPFVFLTARALDSDVRYGKSLGVDDYLTKPIEFADLLAAIEGKLRRRRQLVAATSADEVRVVGTLQIDLRRHRVTLAGQSIHLSSTEFTLLAHLAAHACEAVGLSELVRQTHRIEVDPDEAGDLLRPLIRSIRRKLGYGTGQMGCIETVRGVGYRLVEPSQVVGTQ